MSTLVSPRPVLAVVSLLLCACACVAAELQDRIDRILDAVPRGGEAGVAVYDLGVNQWLARHDARTQHSLASTTKALVAAAALTQLGQNFRFRTQLYGVGAPPRLSALGVIGGGDPCLDGHFTDDDPDKPFRQWAESLRQQGVQAIDGDLVIDNRLFSGPIRPDTYPQDADNQQRWYSAPASAFAWNDNCIEVRVVPTRVGEAAKIEVRPTSRRVTIINRAKTIAGKGDKAIFVVRAADANTVTVTGNYSATTPWFPLAIEDQPDLLAGDHLRSVLTAQGMPVSGTVRIGSVNPRAGRLLIDHASPLIPAVKLMNHNSQNFYGEQILRVLGFERSGEGSIAAGAAATKQILTRLIGSDAVGIAVLDGSGLSYGNEASAEVMVDVLIAMHRSPMRDAFYQSLKERNVGKAEGRVKTGTLAIATCLIGYVDPPSGHRLAFAILFNRGTAKSYDWAPKLRDQIYRLLGDS